MTGAGAPELFGAAMARLGPWADRRVAVAVSGGADSLCLALLARRWGRPLALIVDHGLRASSAAEAALTADRLAARDIPCRILTLRDVPPSAAGARAARYAALTQAALAAGMTELLLGHHAADQAETAALRHAARTGPAGLAGMAEVTVRGGLRLLRPLLAAPPDALRALLRAEGIAWVEDPTNQNPAYARARLRAGMSAAERAVWIARAAACGAARRAQEVRIAEELAARAELRPEGFALLAPGPLSPPALAALLRMIGGAAFAPPMNAVAALAAAPRVAVLGGVRLMLAGRLGPGLLLAREEAAMAPPVPACPGVRWDGRFTLRPAHDAAPPPAALLPGTPSDAMMGATMGALGADAARLRRLSPLPSAVLRTLPALRVAGALAAVPLIGYRGSAFPALRTEFAPAHPAAGAPFQHATGGCEAAAQAPC